MNRTSGKARIFNVNAIRARFSRSGSVYRLFIVPAMGETAFAHVDGNARRRRLQRTPFVEECVNCATR
jgi:hypothetical protein